MKSISILFIFCLAISLCDSFLFNNIRVGYKTLHNARNQIKMTDGDGDLLVRALRGESVERTPVWLMRQVGEKMTVNQMTNIACFHLLRFYLGSIFLLCSSYALF